MKLIIKDRVKCDIFVNTFQSLKSFSDHINININDKRFWVSGLDKNHVCFYELNILTDWFDEFELNDNEDDKIIVIGINTEIMFKILHTKQDNQILEFKYEIDSDKLFISFLPEDKKDFSNHFAMPLIDLEIDNVDVPHKEGEADFSLPTKKFCLIMEQLAIFDTAFKMECTEEGVNCIVDGTEGKMDIAMDIESMEEYSIDEDTTVTNSFSTKLINKACSFNKLAPIIHVSVNNNFPIGIKYVLNNPKSNVNETASAQSADGESDDDSVNTHNKESYMRFLIAPQIDSD